MKKVRFVKDKKTETIFIELFSLLGEKLESLFIVPLCADICECAANTPDLISYRSKLRFCAKNKLRKKHKSHYLRIIPLEEV